MSNIVDQAEKIIPAACRAGRCRKQGCTVSMRKLHGPRMPIDMDCGQLPIQKHDTRCDYVFLGSHDCGEWIAPIERKKDDVHVKEPRDQLQAGAAFAEDRLVPKDAKPRLQPVAAHGGKMRRSQGINLKKPRNRVAFQGKAYEIKLIRCGAALVSAL